MDLNLNYPSNFNIATDDLFIGCHMKLSTTSSSSKDCFILLRHNTLTSKNIEVNLIRTSLSNPQELIMGIGTEKITVNTQLPLDTWVHVQMFLNRTAGNVEFFFNGVSVYTSPTLSMDAGFSTTWGADGSSGTLVGSLDNFYVSTGSINPGELTGNIELPNGDVGNTGFDLDGEASVTDALNASAKAVSSTFASNNFEVNISDVTLNGATIHTALIEVTVASLTGGLAKYDAIITDTNGSQTVILEATAPSVSTIISADVPLDSLGNAWTESTFNSITVKVIHQ